MNDLSIGEEGDLARCEDVIARGLATFIEVGNALLEIRERRLYRAQFGAFEEYCRARWGMSRTHANRMIGAAGVAGDLAPIGVTPANEAQARPLASLDADGRREAWARAVSTAPDGRPTADGVRAVVEEMFPRPAADAVPAEVSAEIGPARRPTFNLTNQNVDWAKWTWNPVTGCEHTCVYCYARDMANRFYKEKFRPTFHAERLEAPRRTKRPKQAEEATTSLERTAWRNVFVCSMADLFGRWVPDKWINAVFRSCRQSPEWNYLFLTKFPQRYESLRFPETAWVGTSVDEQKRVASAEKAFARIDVPLKWLSVEPMLEPLEFSDLRMFDWVVIGGQSRSSGAPEMFPEPDWVVRLIDRALDAGCKVYCKPNTDAHGYWAGLFRRYPDAFSAVG